MTNNFQSSIRLSLEELSVVIGLIGFPEVAKGLLYGQLGEISEDEEKGRLYAANHTLLAKDILKTQGSQTRLSEIIVRLVSPLISNEYSIRGSLGGAGRAEEVLTYYVRGEKLVEHRLILGVVNELTYIKSSEGIAEGYSHFFDIEKCELFDCASFSISSSQLEEAKSKAATAEDNAHSFLIKAGVPDKAGQLLAEDLHQPDYRGSVIRVSSVENQALNSDEGYLLLKGMSGRAWLMDIQIDNDKPILNIEPASQNAISVATQALLHK